MKNTDEIYQESIEKLEEQEAKELGLTLEEYRNQKEEEEDEERAEKEKEAKIEAEAEEIRQQEEEEDEEDDKEAEDFEMKSQFIDLEFNL